MRAAAIVFVSALTVGCSSRRLGGAGDSSSGEIGSDSDASSDAASSDQGSGTDDGPPLKICGNGAIDPGEQCDDGNDVDADGCNADCVASGSVRWSLQLDDVRCGLVAADRQGGIYLTGRDNGSNLVWVARITEPGEIVWKTPEEREPAPLIGFPNGDGMLAGWEVPGQPQAMVVAYDGSGMLQWQTEIEEPDGEDLQLFALAKVAYGQDPVFVTRADLPDGTKRITFWRFDAEGKVDALVAEMDEDLVDGPFVVVTSDGTIVLASSWEAPERMLAYAPSGQILWVETLPDTHRLYDLDAASDGYLYAASRYTEGDDLRQHIVERYSINGSLVTSWMLEPPRNDALAIKTELATDLRNDVYVAGDYSSETDYGYRGLRLAKYSSEGELRWSQSWETSPGITGDSHSPADLAIAANGDAVLAFVDPTEEHHERCHIVAIAP